MDWNELFKLFGPSLGAFGPCALLGWWVIRDQSRRLEAAETRNNALTDKVIEISERTTQVLAELKAAIKGGA